MLSGGRIETYQWHEPQSNQRPWLAANWVSLCECSSGLPLQICHYPSDRSRGRLTSSTPHTKTHTYRVELPEDHFPPRTLPSQVQHLFICTLDARLYSVSVPVYSDSTRDPRTVRAKHGPNRGPKTRGVPRQAPDTNSSWTGTCNKNSDTKHRIQRLRKPVLIGIAEPKASLGLDYTLASHPYWLSIWGRQVDNCNCSISCPHLDIQLV